MGTSGSRTNGTQDNRQIIAELLQPALEHALRNMEDRVAKTLRLVTATWPALEPSDDAGPEAKARELIAAYQAEAGTAEPAQAARLLTEIGRIYEEELGDRRSAAKALLDALRHDAQSANARRSAIRLLVEGDNDELFSKLVDQLVGSMDSVADRGAVLLDYALHQEIERSNPQRAASAYQQVLDSDSASAEACEGLLRLALRARDWRQVGSLCRQLADREEDQQTRSTLLVVAALLSDDRTVEERAAWVAHAASVRPHSKLALPMAVGLFRSADDVHSAIRVQLEQTGAASPEAARLHFQASWMLAQQPDQQAEALEHASKARQYDPDSILYLSWLCELYEGAARWTELAEALRHKADLDTTREECVESLYKLAEILTGHLSQINEASEVLERALFISPTDLACLQALGRLYARSERWEDLARMHLKEASVSKDDHRRASALYGAARVLDRHLGRREEAVVHLEQAIELHAAFTPAVVLIEELYRRCERYQDLVMLYRTQLQAATDTARRTALLERVASLLDTQLDDRQGAITAYEELLELQPDSAPSLQALSRLYEADGRYTTLLSILRGQAMHASSVVERAAILLRMGQILDDEIGNADQALAHYREALDTCPSAQAFEHVGRSLHGLGRWADLHELTRRELEDVGTPADRLRLLFRAARLLEQRLDDPEGAAKAYKEALDVDPGHWPALRGLTRVAHHLPDLRRIGLESMLLEQLSDRATRANAEIRIALSLLTQQRDSAKEILERAVAEDADNAMARDLLIQINVEDGQWAEVLPLVDPEEALAVAVGGLTDPARALDLSKQVIELQADSLCAARWMEWLHSTTEERGSISEALARRAEMEPEGDRRVALWLRLARWVEGKDPDRGDAATMCRQVLAEAPKEDRALDMLERIARRREDCDLLTDVLQRREAQATGDAERSRLQASKGHLLERCGKVEQAVQQWRLALETDAQCRPAYEGLKRTCAADGDNDGLLWALERCAHHVSHEETRIRDLLRRADLHVAKNEGDKALADLGAILEIDPAQINALERLERLLRARGETERLAEWLQKALSSVRLPAYQAALAVNLAMLYRDESKDLRRAAELIGDAIDADPDNVAALFVAADVRRRLDQPTEAVALLNRVVLRSEDKAELIGAHLALGHLFVDPVGDFDRARRSLREVLALDSEHVGALRQLASIAEISDDFEALEPLLRQLMTLDPEQRVATLLRLVPVVSKRLGPAAPEVAELLGEALAAAPGDPELLDLAVENYSASGEWDKLAAVLAEGVGQLSEADRMRFLLTQAEVLSRHLGRRQEARDVLRELVKLDPSREDALELFLEHIDDADLTDADLRGEAIALHRRMLANNPTLVPSLRRLAKLCQMDERPEEALCAEAALVFLNQASEEEVYFYKQRRRRQATQIQGQLDRDELWQVVMPLGDHPLRAVLESVKGHLPELMPPDLSHYGIESLQAGAVGEGHAVAQVMGECARLLSAGDFVVCEAIGGAPEGATEPGSPPAMVVPQDFTRYPVPQQRFLCGRMLARLATHTECCDPGRPEPLGKRSLEILLAALIRSGDAGFGEEIASVAILDDLTGRLRSLMDEAKLEQARQHARRCLCDPEQRGSIETWLRGCEIGAFRAGLLCSGGLDSVAAWSERRRAPLADDIVKGLVAFVTSREYAQMRQRLVGGTPG